MPNMPKTLFLGVFFYDFLCFKAGEEFVKFTTQIKKPVRGTEKKCEIDEISIGKIKQLIQK